MTQLPASRPRKSPAKPTAKTQTPRAGRAATSARREPTLRAFAVTPDPNDARLFTTVTGLDHTGAAIATPVVTERPLTLFLNAREIVTLMTIGDYPDQIGRAHV